MVNDLTITRSGVPGRPSKLFAQSTVDPNAIDAGIGSSFARVTYKAGKWGVKYKGETKLLKRYDAQGREDGLVPYLDCIIVNAASHISKSWYENAYQEGASDGAAPQCFSTTGIMPDPSAPKKQCATCAPCPKNAWGSKRSTDPSMVSRGKDCGDFKRLVVVPVGDIPNKMYGGAMLLAVPPSSLKMLGSYKQALAHIGYNFNHVWTRIKFADDPSYPLLEFDAMRELNDSEVTQLLEIEKDPLVKRILDTEVVAVEGDGELSPVSTLPTTAADTPVHTPNPVTKPEGFTAAGKPAVEPDEPGDPNEPLPEGITAELWATFPEAAKEAMRAAMPKLKPAPPKIKLPPGMTQEMFDGLPGSVKAAMYQAQAEAPSNVVEMKTEKEKKGRGKTRTPPPAPANIDSAAVVAAQEEAQKPLPFAAPTETVTVAGNGQDLDPNAVAGLSKMIDDLV